MHHIKFSITTLHKGIFILLICVMFSIYTFGATLHVGNGFPFTTLTDATDIAVPGDTILIHEGTYSGGIFVGDLQGTSEAWISILTVPGETVIFEGGGNAWQFSDAAYLYISGFIFQQQTGNGVNFDDGGSYDTPAHHVIFDNCIFRDMNASGNNDLLKLSGLDDFEIRNCEFRNGADGGSGVDMVGCHDGLIINCHFEDLGSNSIQAKGGTRNIRIEANFFKNGGERAVNLGGSTGLQFFRPIDATYEAAELKVYSNIFIGSTAPIAFVGTINTEVVNNTIYLPEKWVFRILQETVDETRFAPCGYNTFRNNIIYIDNRVSVEVNIGSNTAPETFTISNNLWFHSQNSNWGGPVLPVVDVDNIVGEDPLFEDAGAEDFSLLEGSPSIGNGLDVLNPALDYNAEAFIIPRSIGAFEGGVMTGIAEGDNHLMAGIKLYPNPANDVVYIEFEENLDDIFEIVLMTMEGKKLNTTINKTNFIKTIAIKTNELMPRTYIVNVKSKNMSKNCLLIIESGNR